MEPGYVGRFGRDGCFSPSGTLEDYKIHFEKAERKRFGAVLLSSGEDVTVKGKISGRLSAAFAFLGKAEAGLKFTAKRQYACVLHMRGISEGWIVDPDRAFEAVRRALLERKWPVDRVVVVRRYKVEQGFAAIFHKAGQSFEVKAAAGLNVVDLADLEGIDFDFDATHQQGGVQFYEFVSGATPTFSGALRVRRDLWDKLLPWRRDRGVLIGPDGSRYTGPPANLSEYLPEDLLYDPGSSAMSPGELAAISLEDLFEEVHTLPPEIDPNLEQAAEPSARKLSFPQRFSLRIPLAPAPLAAADPEREPEPLRTPSPDGQANFFLYARDGKYWLEVTVAPGTVTPVIVSVRYATSASGQQELLVPVEGEAARVASSTVELPGYARGAVEAAVPVPPDDIESWPLEVVTASLRAAVTPPTVRAWNGLVPALPADVGALVRREIAEKQ